MPQHTWFIFDLGNVILKLAYDRVMAGICAEAELSPDALIALLEGPGGYRDLERGTVTFEQMHDLLEREARYTGGFSRLSELWSDFFDGPVEGIENVLRRVRSQYRVAFLSNSNEIHAEVIPRQFQSLFQPDDVFIFSHRLKCAKPDLRIFELALRILGTGAGQCIYVDDLAENVEAARTAGLTAFHFTGSAELLRRLESERLLPGEGAG